MKVIERSNIGNVLSRGADRDPGPDGLSIDSKCDSGLNGVARFQDTVQIRTIDRDSQEVLTDKDGCFTIESRWFFSLNPLVFFRGPFFEMFKPGYGRFAWPGYEGSEKWSKEKRDALRTAAQLLQLDDIELEMPTLRTSDQRAEYLQWLEVRILVVPIDRRPLLQSRIEEERRIVR